MQFFARTDIVVIGTDPENADMENPRGEVYGYAAYVVAEKEDGSRKALYVKTARRDDVALPPAESMAKALNTRFTELGKLPVAFDKWEEIEPCYGSPAYSEIEAELAYRERMDDLNRY